MSASFRMGRRQAFEADASSRASVTHSGSSSYTYGTGSFSGTAPFSEHSGSYDYSYSYSSTQTGSLAPTTASADSVASRANAKPLRSSAVAARDSLPPQPPLAGKPPEDSSVDASKSYSYSYSDSDSYSSEEDLESYSYSSITKSYSKSDEGSVLALQELATESKGTNSYSDKSSTYSGSYGYSYSSGKGTSYTTGSYDSYGSYTGSSGSYSYSTESNARSAKTTLSQATTKMSGTTVKTKQPLSQSSGSYSYSYSESSEESTDSATDRRDSLTRSGTDEGSEMSLTRSAQTSGSSATSLLSSPRHRNRTECPSRHSSSLVTTTSLIQPSQTHSETVSSGVERSSSTLSAKPLPREVLVLRANAEEAPAIPKLPRECLVPHGTEDVLSCFLNRIADVQGEVLRREAEESALAISNKTKEKEKKKKKKNKGKDVPDEKNETSARPQEIPAGHFVRRSLKFALRAVGMTNAAERSAKLNSVFFSGAPVSQDAALALLWTCSHQCLEERVAARFHAHDRFRSGEVPLLVALGLLARCGIARMSTEGAALSLVAVDSRPMLRIASHAETNGLSATAREIPGAEPPPRSTRLIEETIDVCRAGPVGTDAYWIEGRGDVYVGSRLVARGVRTRAAGRALTAHIAALSFVCRAVDACMVGDASRPAVQYPPLLAALIGRGGPGAPRSLIVESATVAVLDPMNAARTLEARVLCAAAAADPLLPAAAARCHEHPNEQANFSGACGGDAEPAGAVCSAVSLLKLRVADAVPAGARCRCLVSARRSAAGEWMAPVEIPALRVRPSRRGGFAWDFAAGAAARVLFAGAAADELYVEVCCGDPDGPPRCVAHALVAAAALRSGPLPLRPGSLAEPSPAASDPSAPAPAPARRLWCAPWASRARLPAAALEVAVTRVRARDLPARVEIPARLLALHRHAPLVARMREAIAHAATAAGSASAAQAVRQQHAQACLTVAASTTLMDTMLTLWESTQKGKLGPKPKEPAQERATVVALATKIAAANNCVACADAKTIAKLVTGAARIPNTVDPQAPLKPIEV